MISSQTLVILLIWKHTRPPYPTNTTKKTTGMIHPSAARLTSSTTPSSAASSIKEPPSTSNSTCNYTKNSAAEPPSKKNLRKASTNSDNPAPTHARVSRASLGLRLFFPGPSAQETVRGVCTLPASFWPPSPTRQHSTATGVECTSRENRRV